ncbi:MAG: NADH-quinone oxidoreductase subunit NuoF [Candidatus Tenebribacter davisii]|nr:NADH-quinone oxidoreductase subunit NuoF [Candidatus Tenebribacter davisii]
MAKRLELLICTGTGCTSNKSLIIAEELKKEITKQGLQDEVEILTTGCRGMCEFGPVIKVYPDNILYAQVKIEDVPHMVTEHFLKGRPVKELIWTGDNKDEIEEHKHPFFEKQMKLVLSNCGEIDPESIDEYIGASGYSALGKVLSDMTPEDVINEITEAGLRGRGGAGFSTGLKWKFTRQAPGDEKYVICNADEGDPGAFMDRSVMEGDPHAILEGMIIAGYAIGATHGFVYTRAEYPLAIHRLQIAIDNATEYGLLGKGIFESNFNFKIEIRKGAGAFVCGEETALIASIEGKRGMPRIRPPFPAQSGLWGKPTNINNVETFANVRHIIAHGAKWYKNIGTETSSGTKVFALAGKIKNSGLIEVPMGMPLREVIYSIGGGMKTDRPFKAVQMGGPSGGCIPEHLLDTIVDYDSINKTGAIMGSGGMVVMDTSSCMVDIAKFFLNFTQNESCGKCTFCRVGTKRMLEILTRITEGKGKMEDLDTLVELSDKIKKTSLCGLGQTAPNPVLTTLKYFKDEYIAHIVDKKCPAGVCKKLVTFEIDPEKCIGCTACARKCPVKCISGTPKNPHVIDQEACIKCGACYDACKFDAITKG